MEFTLEQLKDHARILVRFIENGNLSFCPYDFLDLNTNCKICENFHFRTDKEILQFTIRCPYPQCPCDQHSGYFYHPNYFKNKLKWRNELLKRTWIKIEEVLGNELYNLK